jgi:hypothetical protein
MAEDEVDRMGVEPEVVDTASLPVVAIRHPLIPLPLPTVVMMGDEADQAGAVLEAVETASLMMVVDFFVF